MKSCTFHPRDSLKSRLRTAFFCPLLALFLMEPSSSFALAIEQDPDSAVTRSIVLQTQVQNVSAHKLERGNSDPALIEMLIELAETQSLNGLYENATESLKEALQVNRMSNGLYHQSQIEILDQLIAIEVLMKNWQAVNSLYDLQEHLFWRLFEPTDARLELGLEKITTWHIRAFNEDIDDNARAHLKKVEGLLTNRLDIVANLIGKDNVRYDYLLRNLEYVELELQKIRRGRSAGAGPAAPQHTGTEIE